MPERGFNIDSLTSFLRETVRKIIGWVGQHLASRAVNIEDLRKSSRILLPAPIFGYLDGAADDELSKTRNNSDFNRYELLPRFLVDVTSIDTSVAAMGANLAFPLICSPTGMSRLFHEKGELAVASACEKAGILYSLSTLSTYSIEEVTEVSAGPKWFQIYVFKDRSLISEFMERCRESDFVGLTLTIDVPTQGNRERDIRTGMTIPPKINFSTFLRFVLSPLWSSNYLLSKEFQLANVAHKAPVASSDLTTLVDYLHEQFDQSVTWEDAALMVEEWDGPFAVKGISSLSDAMRAKELGATTLILSNHGGRQLDQTISPIELLPDVRKAVGDEVEIIIDGGIRRGTDIFKAIALGANACSIGRPYLYGLAVNGEAGVVKALEILREEFRRTMALMGVTSVDQITASCLRKRKWQ